MTGKRKRMEVSCLAKIRLLNGVLDSGYKEDFCIVQELLQNADDANSENVIFGISPKLMPGYKLTEAPALYVVNDGPVTESNVNAIFSIAESDKEKDSGKIGKFGLGMKSVFHLSECFFLFGANQPDAGLPQFCSPWEPPFHPDWDKMWDESTEQIAAAATAAMPSLIEKECWQRWLCVWLPLRRREDYDDSVN